MMVQTQDNTLAELENIKTLCQKLMQTPHYAKMGEVGIYAVVNKAKSMGMNPLHALNGGMYFVQGKVEMCGQSMLAFIRSKGHSVSLDPKSTETKIIMSGKRCDNGDSWIAEFSIEDAKKQGIYRNQWEKMPRVMCMWRCVSQLGRFLFSDILHGVYVQGEISESVSFKPSQSDKDESIELEPVQEIKRISKEQVDLLKPILDKCSPEYIESVNSFLKRVSLNSLNDLPEDTYCKILDRAMDEMKKYEMKCKIDEFNELTSLKEQGILDE